MDSLERLRETAQQMKGMDGDVVPPIIDRLAAEILEALSELEDRVRTLEYRSGIDSTGAPIDR